MADEDIPLGQCDNDLLVEELARRFPNGMIFAAIQDEPNIDIDFICRCFGSWGMIASVLQMAEWKLAQGFLERCENNGDDVDTYEDEE